MNTDSVTIAFQPISDEIENVAEGIAGRGANAFRERRHADAKALAATGDRLLDFRAKVDALREEWQAGIDACTRGKTRIPEIQNPESPSAGSWRRGKRKKLRAVFPDGRTEEEHQASGAFIEILRIIGLQKIKNLGLAVRGVPLVGHTRSGACQQQLVEGCYVITHSSTIEKKTMLEDISRRLALRLRVEILK
jgi:hypothetical protein